MLRCFRSFSSKAPSSFGSYHPAQTSLEPISHQGGTRIVGYSETGWRLASKPVSGTLLALPKWAAPVRHLIADNDGSDLFTESERIVELFRSLSVLHAPPLQLFLVGTGNRPQRLPRSLRDSLKQANVHTSIETMASRDAASTFNVLVDEGRQVCALLLPTGVGAPPVQPTDE